ncbi:MULTISPECIES: TonB-dependent receptor plug domain-containing protein [Rodentibacter]|uniref:TonB-dependent receptor plug domain-containing protein n=1 Tax=Rodentibacter TaxID=1960084 RepID=UPI001CFC94EF|nr:TonB-dependent receptor [Rodentibacter sp. JRC1]GJI56415.1 TonB-dependent receptor [Rodentibacter sp. JRC1]
MKTNLITTALLIGLSASAQAESGKNELEPINVYSAYATPINQDKTASSVTVLTEKDFSKRNATYVSDVLKTVPGTAMSFSGGRGTLSNIYLRGADANHTAVIIDGVKVNPVSGYGFDFGGLSLSNVERIEVLRGEQSALWGSDAMGGVIYITTKSGLYKEKPFNIDFDFGTSSHRTRDGSVTLSGYHQGFYYDLHADSHRTSGISALSNKPFSYTAQDGTKISVGNAKEKDKFHRDNTSLRVGYDDNEKGIEFLTSHSSQSVYFDNSLNDETGHRTRTRETLFKLGGYWGNSQDLFKHKASVSHIKTDSDTFGMTSGYDAKKLNANYQLDINFDREGAITQGVSLLGEYQKTTYDSSYFLTNKKELNEKSIAAEYRLLSEQDHSLSLSGRYINSNKYDNSFTGRISGAYRLSPNFKAHASIGNAIQNPTITEYYGYNGQYIGNPNLKPEKSRGGDIGLLIENTDKSHHLDITYFARNVENFISSQSTGVWPNTVTRSINLEGKTKIKGIEIAYNGKLTEDLTVYANYTYTQTKDSKGKELNRRPKHTANAGLAYQVTEKLGTNVNVSYVSQRMDNYYESSPPYATRAVKLPSYTLANLGVDYQLIPNLTLYANLNNLFDKKYENILGYGQDGRNVYVGLKGSF